MGKVEEKSGKVEEKSGKVEEKSGKVEEKLGKVEEIGGNRDYLDIPRLLDFSRLVSCCLDESRKKISSSRPVGEIRGPQSR